MKNIYKIAFCVLLIAGCSKNNDPVKTPGCLLTQYTDSTPGSSNSNITNITYTSDNKVSAAALTQTNDGGVTTLYNATLDSNGKITKLIPATTPGESQPSSETFIFDAGGVLTKTTVAYGSNGSFEETYFYNGTGQLIHADLTIKDSDGNSYFSYQAYTYPNTTTHNPSVIDSYNEKFGAGGSRYETQSFTYDTKKTPESAAVTVPNYSSDNNILTEVAIISPDTDNATTSHISYTYTYSDAGYPLTISHTISGTVHNETYTYTCK